ncbi:hypothetical protein EW146_g6153 [Bondarzewia mesenterica]|uniref:C2 domain-containing protein n=1 Tax=Bondarzewia mesenterica TaxID=1095465 RepID=A0A4S4LPI8_9AGAM|nr:hypothetical protein EW146_g6153 [Bondarzewia mesenterica]
MSPTPRFGTTACPSLLTSSFRQDESSHSHSTSPPLILTQRTSPTPSLRHDEALRSASAEQAKACHSLSAATITTPRCTMGSDTSRIPVEPGQETAVVPREEHEASDIRLKVTVQQVVGIPQVKVLGFIKDRKVYAALIVGGQKQKTDVVKVDGSGSVQWSRTFDFDTRTPFGLEFRLYGRHMMWKHKFLGGFKVKINDLPEPPDISRNLTIFDARGQPQERSIRATLWLTAEPDYNRAQRVMGEVTQKVVEMKPVSGAVDEVASGTLAAGALSDNAANFSDAWSPLLDKLRTFIHPYAKMAWFVLSAIPKTIVKQNERDQRITGLLKTLNEVLDLMNEAKDLGKIESHKQILTRMSQQTVECGYFIRSYANDHNFWKRTGKNIMSSADSTIEQYQTIFISLRSQLQESAGLHTNVAVLHVESMVCELSENLRGLGLSLHHLSVRISLNWPPLSSLAASDFDLREIPCADGARFASGKICLAGTREAILEGIENWINDADDVRRVCLLSGVAGTGKSSIAHTIAHRFNVLGRLGSSFCFDRGRQKDRGPATLFRTLARNLADHNPQFKEALGQILHNNVSLCKTEAPEDQFENFLRKPCEKLLISGPVIVVIDALDESGDPRVRKDMLTILAKGMPKLPSNFRIFVTARPENDICKLFHHNDRVLVKNMTDIEASSTTRDIQRYIRRQLYDEGRFMQGFSESHCDRLAELSEGLFQWAFVACAYIEGLDGQAGRTTSERLKDISESRTSRADLLDDPYSNVLKSIFNMKRADIRARFGSVMGQILAAFEPLSMGALVVLRSTIDPGDGIESVKSIVQFMGSLLSGVTGDDHSVPIQPLHTSFRDFLTDPLRGGDFYVDVLQPHSQLALASLRVMNRDLRFNICRLETSYLRNADVPGLAERVSKAISPLLSYSCRFWADHLNKTLFNEDILKEIEDFLLRKILFWFEVSSLIDALPTAGQALVHGIRWVNLKPKATKREDDILNFLRDAQSLVRCYGRAFSESTPHLYLSALPFFPQSSAIYNHFTPSFTGIPYVINGRSPRWPVLQNILKGHTDDVCSVAYSPDGKHIASGSGDGIIRIWDAEMGVQMGDSLVGHTERVLSVAYSPDGKCIASGSDDYTIRIWDAETTAPIGEHKQKSSLRIDSSAHIYPSVSFSSCLDHASRNAHLADFLISRSPPSADSVHLSMPYDGGWVGPQSKLFLWIPEEHREKLWWPRTKTMIPARSDLTMLDLSHYKFGPDWHRCYQDKSTA